MPYDIVKQGGNAKPYKVIKQDTGEVMGEFKTRDAAEAQMRALYANEPRAASTSPGTDAGGGDVLDDTYTPTPGEGFMDGKRVKRE